MLRLAYLANVVILAPVALITSFSEHAMTGIFERKFTDAEPLRILLGCFWAAILLCSIVGFAQPRAVLAVLVLQVVYKALFLALFIVPVVLRDGLGAAPVGVTMTFVAIVLLWPMLLWLDQDPFSSASLGSQSSSAVSHRIPGSP